MTVSVVVACLRRDEATEKLLSDIRRQASAGGADLDLVVVEGLSPVGRARNEAMNRACGDFITWVDCDDEILEGWWRSIVGALEEDPDVVVFGLRDEKTAQDVLPGSRSADAPALFQAVLRDEAPYAYLCNKVFRRSLWEGVRFDEDVPFQVDFIVLPSVLSKATRSVAIDKVLYHYRFNPNGVSRSRDPDRLDVALRVRWERFEKWQRTSHAADAITPFVGLCGCFFSELRDRSRRKVLHKHARRLLGYPLLTLRCPLPCRSFKLKALLAACGF